MIDYAKKGYKIACVALVFAIIGWILPGSIITESIFEIEVNNTNLAPSVAGEPPGTGERVAGTTYYANETPLDVYVFAHAATSGDQAEVHLFINGTKIQDQSDKPVGIAEQTNNSVSGRVPRYASYKIEVNNAHHYEWREYRVISGQNGSVSLTTNYYNTTGGSVDNTTLNTKVNKSGDTMTGNLNMGGNNISNCANCSEFSKLIKTTSYITGEITSGSTTIPHDDTIPQITEGNFFGNVTITPASSSSKIKVCSQIMLSTSQVSPNLLQIMIFINGSNNASAISSTYSPAAFYEVNTGVCYTTQVPTTNSFNVTARYGSNAAGTITVNGANLGRQYGGAYNSYIIVDEYKD